MIQLGKSRREPRIPKLRDDVELLDDAIGGKRTHAHQRYAADPKAAAPDVHVDHRHLLTSSRRVAAGTGDLRPVTIRAGAEQAAQYPSRSGDRLTWPDGRRTRLDGSALDDEGS